MSASRTAIANRALTKVGAARIIDLTDDTPEGRAVNSMYDIERRALLSSHSWNFAKRDAELPALAETPIGRFAYQYELPADCLAVHMVGDSYDFPMLRSYSNAPGRAWEIQRHRVLTNRPAPLLVTYITDTEEDQHPLFDNALACKLAVELNEIITQGGAQKRELLLQQFRWELLEARRVNAIQLPPDPLPDNSWVFGRR